MCDILVRCDRKTKALVQRKRDWYRSIIRKKGSHAQGKQTKPERDRTKKRHRARSQHIPRKKDATPHSYWHLNRQPITTRSQHRWRKQKPRRQLTHRRKRYNATQLLTPQSTTDNNKKSTQIRNANCVKHCSSTTPSTVFAIPDISAQETQFAHNKQCQEVPELLQMTLRQDTNRKLLW